MADFAGPRLSDVKVREVMCKSLMNESKLADYCINPYVGCEHSCSYCYARPITARFSHHAEQWGRFVDVKINALDILKREVGRKPKGNVFISSLCDAYGPVEKKYKLTRGILQMLLAHGFPVTIQTKSALVARDIDILKKFQGIGVEVGFTFTSLDDEVRKVFEPLSSSVQERLAAVNQLAEAGIPVYVFLGPVLPGISFKDDDEIRKYVKTFKDLGVGHMFVDKLNLRPGVWEDVTAVLQESGRSDLVGMWQDIFFSREGAKYWKDLELKISSICSEIGMDCKFCYSTQ
jgi:DNA repair photolyase